MARFPHVLAMLAIVAGGFFAGCSNRSAPVVVGPAKSASASAAMSAPRVAATASETARPLARGAARDAYVLISGGGTPLSNNYSQYLQAKAVAQFFERECPPDSTWIFFGAGNRDGAPPVLADAHRQIKQDGILVESWVAGTLPRNRAATRDNILRALREEILPTVSGGGTLYLFVGDHGELTGKGADEESAITLWEMKRGRRRGMWVTDEDEFLSVSELRRALTDRLGNGRVVFCMTQCHGGGFHALGIDREMSAPREWFARVPAWATSEKGASVRLRVAGFTATDQASLAAGCDPDPDPKLWAGYERFLPEKLFGIDLLSAQPKGEGTRSFAAAHEAATLIDRTIDKPRATSEYFLEAWARLIETRLVSATGLTPAAQQAVEGFEAAVDSGRINMADEGLRERQKQFARFTEQLTADVPAVREVLLTGTQRQLEQAMRGRGERSSAGVGVPRGNRRTAMTELRRAWSETVRPAWKSAVLANRITALEGAALEFEKHLLKEEEDGRNFLLPRGGDDTPLLNELYWESGYADPTKLDRAKAEAMARWTAQRRARIIAWAKNSPDAAVRSAAERIGPGPGLEEEGPRPMTRRTAAERVLFYRRVLAAWEFLVRVHAEAALAELHAIIELERTPLRPSGT